MNKSPQIRMLSTSAIAAASAYAGPPIELATKKMSTQMATVGLVTSNETSIWV